MKILIKKRLQVILLIPLILLIACEQNFIKSDQASSNKSQTIYDLSSFQILSITDKSGGNKIILRVSCQNPRLLKELSEKKYELVTKLNKDPGRDIEASSDHLHEYKKPQVREKLRIEIIEKSFEVGVIGYYIKNNSLSNESTLQYNAHCETEFISEIETMGGNIQIYQDGFRNQHSIWIKAETLDDPMVKTKSDNFKSTSDNPYLSIGFSDRKGLTHAWRVVIRHDLSTFPIVYWIGEEVSVKPIP